MKSGRKQYESQIREDINVQILWPESSFLIN